MRLPSRLTLPTNKFGGFSDSRPRGLTEGRAKSPTTPILWGLGDTFDDSPLNTYARIKRLGESQISLVGCVYTTFGEVGESIRRFIPSVETGGFLAEGFVKRAYYSLEKGDAAGRELFKRLTRAFSDLEENAFCGIQIQKRLIPKSYLLEVPSLI